MIGPEYQSLAIQAALGPGQSRLFPAVLWGAWLDASLNVIAMTGVAVSQDSFGESGLGVTNIGIIDGGLYPSTAPVHFALMDADDAGVVVHYAPVTFNDPFVVGDPVLFAPGTLAFPYVEA